MSQNINQIYIANPASTMQNTDLLYLGRSPYNITDDFAIAYIDFALAIQSTVGFTWTNITGTTQAALVNHGYVIGNALLTTVTLPAIAAIGSVVSVRGQGAGGWILAANIAQIINVDGQATSASGTLASTSRYDSIDVTCVVANSVWIASSIVSTGLTFS